MSDNRIKAWKNKDLCARRLGDHRKGPAYDLPGPLFICNGLPDKPLGDGDQSSEEKDHLKKPLPNVQHHISSKLNEALVLLQRGVAARSRRHRALLARASPIMTTKGQPMDTPCLRDAAGYAAPHFKVGALGRSSKLEVPSGALIFARD